MMRVFLRGRMLLLFYLLCLPFTAVNIAAAESYERYSYPLEDLHLEGQGIYTGYRVPNQMLVFEVGEKSVLTVESHAGSNETISVRKTMTVRDTFPVLQKSLSPNLTDLKQKGGMCVNGPSQGTRDIYSLLGKKFMAVWTFSVPANQCFGLQFITRIQQGWSEYYNHHDRLTILDGELLLPFTMKSGVSQYDLPPQNDTTTVSVVYFYTSLGRNVYWQMAPSLKTIDCTC